MIMSELATKIILAIWIVALAFGCSPKKDLLLFTAIESNTSGIHFQNTVTETEQLLDSVNNWQFVKENILDKEKGEWVWGIKEDHSLMEGEDKVGIWKCPYHNSRACFEIIKRIKKTNSSSMQEQYQTFL
jgi:mannose/cellobiose epimerase-like protein (N-acyl-D-glucosamine 2-epimerase family)